MTWKTNLKIKKKTFIRSVIDLNENELKNK